VFDILRIKQTNGWNYDLGPDDIIDKLLQWSEKYSIAIIGADFDWVELLFTETPTDLESLANEVYEFSPDTVDQGTETLEALIESIRDSSVLFLWWD